PAPREAQAVTRAAAAGLRVAAARRAAPRALGPGVSDGSRELEVGRVAALGDQLALRILDVLRDDPAEESIRERLDHARLVGVDEDAVLVAAVLQPDDHVLRDGDETAREVARAG